MDTGAVPPQSSSPPPLPRGDQVLSSLLESPSFSSWFCLRYLCPSTVCVLHALCTVCKWTHEGRRYFCTLFFSFTSILGSPVSVVLYDLPALYEHNMFYSSAVDEHFNLFQIFCSSYSFAVRVSWYVCKRNSLGIPRNRMSG